MDMPSAISFPLPGGFWPYTLKKRASPGAHKSKYTGATKYSRTLLLYNFVIFAVVRLAGCAGETEVFSRDDTA